MSNPVDPSLETAHDPAPPSAAPSPAPPPVTEAEAERREQEQPAGRWFFFLLLAAAAVLVWELFTPLFTPLLFGAVISMAMYPLQQRLSKKLRGKRTLAAGLLTAGFVLIILVPVTLLGVSVVKQSIALGQSIIAAVRSGGIDGLVDRAPTFARKGLDYAVTQLELNRESLQEKVGALGAESVGFLAAVLGGVGTALANAVFMLIALVVFLVEGPAIGAWARHTSPLNADQTAEILGEFRKVSSSIVVANVGTSAAQAVVALLGFLITRTPNVLVATAVTFFMAFVPAAGAASTVLLAAALHLAAGRTWQGIFLLVWGLVVVGLIDNVLKPVFMKQGAEMHGAIVFFAIIAGIAAFGPAGFMVGPMIAVFAVTLTRIYRRDFRTAGPA